MPLLYPLETGSVKNVGLRRDLQSICFLVISIPI